jgi:hypothetical protein
MFAGLFIYFALTLTLSLNGKEVERSDMPHDPRHLGDPSGMSKTISRPMVPLMETVQLYCVKISTIS